MNKDNSADLFFQQVMEYEVEPKNKEKVVPDAEKGKAHQMSNLFLQ